MIHHDKQLIKSKFYVSVSTLVRQFYLQLALVLIGATVLAWGWLLAERNQNAGSTHPTQLPIDLIVRVIGATLLVRGMAPFPRLYGYVALFRIQMRPGNLMWSSSIFLAALALASRPLIAGIDAAFVLNLLLFAGCAFSVLGTCLYFRILRKYLRRAPAEYGPRTSGFLDLSMNPRVIEARYMYYYLSVPLVLAVALLSWRVTPLLLWIELNRIQALVRVIRPPFALFLTAAYQAAEADMLKLRMACGGHTMMHLLVDSHGLPPYHPRLAEDTFRIRPGVEGDFQEADWRNAVRHLARVCGLVIVDTRAFSAALHAELDLIEENNLFHKTLFIDAGQIAPQVLTRLDRWRTEGRTILIQDVETAARFLRNLSVATFPSDTTPLERIVVSPQNS